MGHLNEMITSLQMGAGFVHSPAGAVSWFANSTPGSTRAFQFGAAEGGKELSTIGNGSDFEDGVPASSFGHKVVSAKFSSPDGFQQFYNERSPPLFSGTGGLPGKAGTFNDADLRFSRLKSDALLSKPNVIHSNVSPPDRVEREGYYKGLPIGTGTPSNDVSALRAGAAGLNEQVRLPRSAANKPKYHWQSPDYGISDELASA
jgi:hypothetical protein